MSVLLKNIKWAFVGNVVFAAAKWGILVVLTKTTDLNTVGHFVFGLAVAAPVFAFFNLQLRGVQASDAGDEFSTSEYYYFRLLSTLIAFLTVNVIAQFGGGSDQIKDMMFLIALWKSFESIADIIYGYFQKNESMEVIAFSLIMKGALGFVVVVVLMYNGAEALSAILALAVSWLLILLVFDFPRYQLMRKKNNDNSILRLPSFVKRAPKLLLLAFPMGIVILLHNLNLNVPKYVVEYFLGEAAIGIYASIAYVIVVGTTIIAAIGQSALPRLAKYREENLAAFSRLLRKVIFLGFAVGICGIFFSYLLGGMVLTNLYSEEFAKYDDLFVIIMVSAAFLYISTIIGCGLTALRLFRPQALLSFITLILITVFSFYLTPKFGMEGAAVSMGIGFLCHSLLSYLVVRNSLGLKYEK